MIKAQFRDSMRSKTDKAMRNEVLRKILAHNICCLIMSQFELGIEPEFWGQSEEAKVKEVIEAVPVPVPKPAPVYRPCHATCAGA